jgi:hypothetical protein
MISCKIITTGFNSWELTHTNLSWYEIEKCKIILEKKGGMIEEKKVKKIEGFGMHLFRNVEAIHFHVIPYKFI